MSAIVLIGTVLVVGQAAGLSTKQTLRLEQACRAFERGQSIRVIQRLAPVVNQCDDGQLAQIDAMLADRKLPNAGELLASARFKYVAQGLSHQLPRAGAREVVFVLSEVGRLVESRVPSPIEQDAPLSDDLESLSRAISALSIQERQLESIQSTVHYAMEMLNTAPRKELRRLSKQNKGIVESAKQWTARIRSALSKAESLELQFRLRRMNAALAALSSKRLSKEKYKAAFFIERDASRIADLAANEGLYRIRRGTTEETLTGQQLISQVNTDADTGRRLAGQLSLKAKLLAEGLDWWYRGRYGQGTDYRGLVKSEFATQVPNGLLWLRLPSGEPDAPPVPLAATTDRGETSLSRRHYLFWAIDDVLRLQHFKLAGELNIARHQLRSVVAVTGYC